jgi:hypothetical protein
MYISNDYFFVLYFHNTKLWGTVATFICSRVTFFTQIAIPKEIHNLTLLFCFTVHGTKLVLNVQYHPIHYMTIDTVFFPPFDHKMITIKINLVS